MTFEFKVVPLSFFSEIKKDKDSVSRKKQSARIDRQWKIYYCNLFWNMVERVGDFWIRRKVSNEAASKRYTSPRSEHSSLPLVDLFGLLVVCFNLTEQVRRYQSQNHLQEKRQACPFYHGYTGASDGLWPWEHFLLNTFYGAVPVTLEGWTNFLCKVLGLDHKHFWLSVCYGMCIPLLSLAMVVARQHRQLLKHGLFLCVTPSPSPDRDNLGPVVMARTQVKQYDNILVYNKGNRTMNSPQ